MSHQFLSNDDRRAPLGELPTPSIFSKRNQGYTSARVFSCVICGDPISSESSQKGMKRTKCDYCKKEKDRLVNMMYYWMNKVGIKFDIEEFDKDFDTEEDDGTGEF